MFSPFSAFNKPHEIIPNLFLANYRAVQNLLSGKRPFAKITHLLTIAEELDLSKEASSQQIEYKRIPASDYPGFDLQQYFTEITDFIHQSLSAKGVIVVHCLMGVSRSATAVIAYLIRFKGLRADVAYDLDDLVREKRSVISPNDGFLSQLKKYEKLFILQEENEEEKNELN